MSELKYIIFSDLDGTLLDHYSYSADEALSTLTHLKSLNIPVVLNTSKTFAETEIIQKDLELGTPFIIENGAAVCIPKAVFTEQPDDTVELGNYWVKSFSLPRKYWLKLLGQQSTSFKGMYKGFSQMSVEEISSLTGLSAEQATRASEREYGEPLQWLDSDESKNIFIKNLEAQGANVLQGGRFMHVCGHCDKGQALNWLVSQYRQHYQQHDVLTIALGDSFNDIKMLEAADIAVQIRSHTNEFPVLANVEHKTIIQTEHFGPKGWANAINDILST